MARNFIFNDNKSYIPLRVGSQPNQNALFYKDLFSINVTVDSNHKFKGSVTLHDGYVPANYIALGIVGTFCNVLSGNMTAAFSKLYIDEDKIICEGKFVDYDANAIYVINAEVLFIQTYTV